MVGDVVLSSFSDTYDGRLGTVKGTIFGNDGNDTFRLGLGVETLDGGNGFDTLDFSSRAGTVVNLTTQSQNTGAAAGDTYSNIEQILGSLTGNDRLVGDLNANTLNGQGGNDTLDGAAGNDSLIGGAGNDALTGGTDNDTLLGGAGNDVLQGSAGLDSLVGDVGRDLLYGGADSLRDVFVFTKTTDSVVGTNRDVIYNFLNNIDDISLTAIDANVRVAGNQNFAWGGTVAKAYGVWITDTGTDILVRADVNGDRVADMEILVKSVATLGVGDFLL